MSTREMNTISEEMKKDCEDRAKVDGISFAEAAKIVFAYWLVNKKDKLKAWLDEQDRRLLAELDGKAQNASETEA